MVVKGEGIKKYKKKIPIKNGKIILLSFPLRFPISQII